MIKYYLQIGTLAVIISSCTKEQCFETYLFSFSSTNDLVSNEISLGDSFEVRIEIPHQLYEKNDSILYNIDGYDFYTQVNFKEYSNANGNLHQQSEALDKFDWTLTQGVLQGVDVIEPVGALYENVLILLPEDDGMSQGIKIIVKPKETGTFFIYLRSIIDLPQFVQQNLYDMDDCFDETFYQFHNATKNDYSFLEGEIQDTTTQLGTFLDSWSGIAFIVK